MSGIKRVEACKKRGGSDSNSALFGAFVYFSTLFGVRECSKLFFGLLKPLPPFFSSSDEKKL
jgi:hypothetical protein